MVRTPAMELCVRSLCNGYTEAWCCCCLSPCQAVNCCAASGAPVAIVTGGNRGVGFYTAKVLAARGYHVVIGCRNTSAGAKAVTRIQRQVAGANIECLPLDLANLATVRSFVEAVVARKLAVKCLVNNAGMIGAASVRVNHVGHFALVMGLWDSLKLSGARIINLASCAHAGASIDGMRSNMDALTTEPGPSTSTGGDQWGVYGLSKGANVVFTEALTQLSRGTAVSVCSVHPGVLMTGLWRDSPFAAVTVCFECIFACKPVCQSGGFIAQLASSGKTFRSGGYYQQCFCCCHCPAAPVIDKLGNQAAVTAFWNTSCDATERLGYAEAATVGRQVLADGAGAWQEEKPGCGSALGACLSMLPNGVCCFTALC